MFRIFFQNIQKIFEIKQSFKVGIVGSNSLLYLGFF